MNTALIPLQSFYFLVGYGVLVILHDEAWVSRDKWSFGRFCFIANCSDQTSITFITSQDRHYENI
jgi:hypothetical protein